MSRGDESLVFTELRHLFSANKKSKENESACEALCE
jgi:hypothetical protein